MSKAFKILNSMKNNIITIKILMLIQLYFMSKDDHDFHFVIIFIFMDNVRSFKVFYHLVRSKQ